jgi:UDP-N-acetylmuramoyl-tripeptide--D-alanyl-D-alanine ligase
VLKTEWYAQTGHADALERDDMVLFTVEQVLEITGARAPSPVETPRLRQGIARITTDSRDVRPKDLFVALQGERYDGHDFVGEALRRGAVGAIVRGDAGDRPTGDGALLLAVPDTLRAYQQLAAHHRSRFDVPLVAVTGSNGKTTSKDMTAAVLAERGTVLKTEGNLNNQVGVPRTLLGLSRRHEAAVIELGVDRVGQTTRLCEIVRPTIGIITNIGPDHLEFLGTIEVSAQSKAELLDMMPADGAVVLNADDPYYGYLAAWARCRVVSFGLSDAAQVSAREVIQDVDRGLRFQLVLPGRTRHPHAILRVHGAHNLSNALAAAAVGHLVGMSGLAIARGLATFRPASMRSEVSRAGGVTIINDCYNANPSSMKAAIDLLVGLGAGSRTIAVLGDMLELGAASAELHREVGVHLGRAGVAELIAVGELGRGLAEGARSGGLPPERIREAADGGEAARAARALLRAGDVVLVKASRGMRLEQVVDALKAGRGAQ